MLIVIVIDNRVLLSLVFPQQAEVVISLLAELEVFFVKRNRIVLRHPSQDVRRVEQLRFADDPDLSVQVVKQVLRVVVNQRIVIYLWQRVLSLSKLQDVLVALADNDRHLAVHDVQYLYVDLEQQVVLALRCIELLEHRQEPSSQLLGSGQRRDASELVKVQFDVREIVEALQQCRNSLLTVCVKELLQLLQAGLEHLLL